MTKHECAACGEIVRRDRAVLAEVRYGVYGYKKETYYCAWCWIEKGFHRTPNVIETRAGMDEPNPSRSDGCRYDGYWDNAIRTLEGT